MVASLAIAAPGWHDPRSKLGVKPSLRRKAFHLVALVVMMGRAERLDEFDKSDQILASWERVQADVPIWPDLRS